MLGTRALLEVLLLRLWLNAVRCHWALGLEARSRLLAGNQSASPFTRPRAWRTRARRPPGLEPAVGRVDTRQPPRGPADDLRSSHELAPPPSHTHQQPLRQHTPCRQGSGAAQGLLAAWAQGATAARRPGRRWPEATPRARGLGLARYVAVSCPPHSARPRASSELKRRECPPLGSRPPSSLGLGFSTEHSSFRTVAPVTGLLTNALSAARPARGLRVLIATPFRGRCHWLCVPSWIHLSWLRGPSCSFAVTCRPRLLCAPTSFSEGTGRRSSSPALCHTARGPEEHSPLLRGAPESPWAPLNCVCSPFPVVL